MPRQGAIVAVLAIAGLASSFMFTLVVPIQAKLPELLEREPRRHRVGRHRDAARRRGDHPDRGAPRRHVRQAPHRAGAARRCSSLGSVIAALSTGIVGVIIGRALQGAVIGVVPLGISILRDVLHEDRVDSRDRPHQRDARRRRRARPADQRARHRSTATGTCCSGWPPASASSCFALVLWIVPVSVLRTAGRFDYVGAAGLAIGLIGILLAISRGNEWGWTSPADARAAASAASLVLLVWGWYELRIDEPLLDLRVAARRPVLLTNIASIAMGFSLFASNVVFPQMLELPAETGAGFGLSLLAASLVIMPAGPRDDGALAGLRAAGRARSGPKLLLVLGAVALIAAYGFSCCSPPRCGTSSSRTS